MANPFRFPLFDSSECRGFPVGLWCEGLRVFPSHIIKPSEKEFESGKIVIPCSNPFLFIVFSVYQYLETVPFSVYHRR